MGSAGTQTDGLVFGGFNNPPPAALARTDLYNGTSWTNVGTMATARDRLGSGQNASPTNAAIGFGGPPNSTATEEWTGIALATRTITNS